MDSLQDYMYRYYSSLVTGGSSMSGAINVSRAAVGIEATNSIVVSNKVAAPAANANIAQIVSLPAGVYEVEVSAYVGGTTADLDTDNMKLYLGTSVFLGLITPGGGGVTTNKTRIALPSATGVSVKSIVAATADSIYYANIVCSKIGY